MIIYQIMCCVNNKFYIGQTTNRLCNRWAQHMKAARDNNQMPLYRAMRKYGKQSFRIAVIDTAKTQQELDDKERAWIAKENAMNPARGYNLREGGAGGKVSIESRERMRRAHLGVRLTESTKRKMSEVRKGLLKGRKFTPEWRAKISANTAMRTPEARERMRKVHLGTTLTTEHRKKIGQGVALRCFLRTVAWG